MNEKTRKPGSASDLEHDLTRLQADWQRSEQRQAEPPDLVDRAVLNAARRDLEPAHKVRPLRWIGGFATAAVVVLTFAVMLDRPTPAVDVSGAPKLEKSMREGPAPAAAQRNAAESEEAASPARLTRDALPAAPPRAMSREARRQEPLPEQLFSDDEALPGAEAWIEELLAMKRAGLDEELKDELEAFRSAYPDVPLPAELVTETP